jgi:hypothetical protein
LVFCADIGQIRRDVSITHQKVVFTDDYCIIHLPSDSNSRTKMDVVFVELSERPSDLTNIYSNTVPRNPGTCAVPELVRSLNIIAGT